MAILLMKNNRASWQQHGFAIYPKAVALFYVLRCLQESDLSGGALASTIHHQFLWDIRMHEPVYKAFSEVLGTRALWASLDPQARYKVEGGVCLQKTMFIPDGYNGYQSVHMGDLLIYDTTRYRVHPPFDSDPGWLPLTLIPAIEEDDALVQQRRQSWNDKSCQTYLSPLGYDLLGLKP